MNVMQIYCENMFNLFNKNVSVKIRYLLQNAVIVAVFFSLTKNYYCKFHRIYYYVKEKLARKQKQVKPA